MEELRSLPVDVLARLRPILKNCAAHWPKLIALAVALSFVPAALLLRHQLERRALSAALHGLGVVGTWVAQPPPAPPHDEEFFPLLPQLGGASRPRLDGASAVPRASQPRGHKKHIGAAQPWAAPPILPEPVSSRASAQQVLSWASARLMPVGRSRGAGYGLPAGIELSGVAGLGIGLLDGDRLVAVDGAPISERTQVISLVLSARGRHEPRLVATLWRRTPSGPRTFSVTVDQPYPTGVAGDSSRAPGSAVSPSPAVVPASPGSP